MATLVSGFKLRSWKILLIAVLITFISVASAFVGHSLGRNASVIDKLPVEKPVPVEKPTPTPKVPAFTEEQVNAFLYQELAERIKRLKEIQNFPDKWDKVLSWRAQANSVIAGKDSIKDYSVLTRLWTSTYRQDALAKLKIETWYAIYENGIWVINTNDEMVGKWLCGKLP